MTVQLQENAVKDTTHLLPRRQFILALLLVWLAWFMANLAANGLFYIAVDNPAV